MLLSPLLLLSRLLLITGASALDTGADDGSRSFLLDPLATATFMIYFIASMTVLMNVTPGFFFVVYGGAHSPLNDRLVQTYAMGAMSVLVLAYCLLVTRETTSLVVAYRFSLLPCMLDCLRNLWKEEYVKPVGFSKGGQWMILAISATILFATTQEYAETAMILASIFELVNGLYLIVDPKQATDSLWGPFPTYDATSGFMLKMMGFNRLARSTFVLSMLLYKVNALKAFGIAYSSFLVKLLWLLFVSKDVQKAEFDSRLLYMWVVIHGYVVATLLLQS